MYKLIIQDDEGKTIVVPLIRDEFTIGRKEGNTIRLTERNVSRKHARIVKSDGTVVVEDLDSYNGVKVNGTRIQGRVAVKESDRIQIGDYLLELKVDRGAQAGDANVSPSSPDMQMQAMGGAALPTHAPTPALGTNGAAALQARAAKPTQPLGPQGQYDSQPPHTPSPVPAAPAVAAVGTNPGRLVVVSSNFSGREFILSKPTMVIGRTDDNDIVVNHRSISRHHAKVVLESGRYCIVDMQSSNGVRVNGEEYGKVELRRGDVVDLGHVRLRYVEPGEDFVFERDAQVVDIAGTQRPGKAKGVAIALLSVAVLGGAAAVFLFTTRNGTGGAVATAPTAPNPNPTPTPTPTETATASKPPEPTPAAVKPAEPTPTLAVAAAASADGGAGQLATAPTEPPKPVEAATAPKPSPPNPKDESDRLIAEAKEAMGSEKWLDAYAAAEKALAADPGNAEAKKLQEQAHAEQTSQQIYKKFGDARDANKASDALKLLGQIPKDSSYREKAEADVPALKAAYIKEREAEAKSLAGRGLCDRIAALARRSGDVFPEAKAAVEKAGAHCVQQTAASPPPSSDGGETAPASGGSVDQLISDAREAARNANWIEARKKADEVLRSSPDNQDALSVAGVAACNLADKDRAQRYMSKLKGARQNMMKQICASRGVMME